MQQLHGHGYGFAGRKPCSCGPVKQLCQHDLSKATAAPAGRQGAAARGGHDLAMASAGRLVVAARVWTVDGYVSVAFALCGPSVVVLVSRPTVPSAEGCFGWLNRRGYAGA